MHNLTILPSLIGGLLIGAAAALLMLFIGRIAGISGILGGVLTGARGSEARWRLAFLGGLLAGGAVMFLVNADFYADYLGRALPIVAVAGLLVGFGTRLGSGCTSGHGVCGISRLAPRSLVATVAFMATGVAGAWLGKALDPTPPPAQEEARLEAPAPVEALDRDEAAGAIRVPGPADVTAER